MSRMAGQSFCEQTGTHDQARPRMKYRTVVTLGNDDTDSQVANDWPSHSAKPFANHFSHQCRGSSCSSSIPALGTTGTRTVISKPSFKVIPNHHYQRLESEGQTGLTDETGAMRASHSNYVNSMLEDAEDLHQGFHSPDLTNKARTSASTSGVSSSSSSLDNHDSGLEDGACSPVEECTQKFYLLETDSDPSTSGLQDDQHPFFIGSRDVRDPSTLAEMKIVSSKGTVRGFKNRVRAGIMSFLDQQEKGKVSYFTTI